MEFLAHLAVAISYFRMKACNFVFYLAIQLQVLTIAVERKLSKTLNYSK